VRRAALLWTLIVLGLAALMCLAEARRPARRTPAGLFVPLDEQDPGLWDRVLVDRGEALLHRAHSYRRQGRYQLEAAIQSAHCDRARTGRVDWQALRTLHRGINYTLAAVVAIHALAALKHRFVDRDEVLAYMLPFLRKP